MNIQISTDAELIQRFIKSSDQAAYAELVRRHAAMVYRIGRRLAGNAHDAEDAAQKVFAKLAERAGDLVDHRSIAGWLYSTAWHIATNERRTVARRRRYERRMALDHKQASVVPIERQEFHFELYRALEMLPPDYRTAIVLHHLEGLRIAQIAEMSAEPVGTIAARISRGRAMLRERLANRDLVFTSTVLVKALEDELNDEALAFDVPHVTSFELPLSAKSARDVGVASSAMNPSAYLTPVATIGFAGNSLRVAGAVLKGWPARTAAAVLVLSVASSAPAARRFASAAGGWVLRLPLIQSTAALVHGVDLPKHAAPDSKEAKRPAIVFGNTPIEGLENPISIGGRSARGGGVPEPASAGLIAIGAGFTLLRRRPH